MLRQGPVPLFLHGILDYAAGVLFLAAPWLFGFDDVAAATAVCIAVGVGVLLLAASTQWPPSFVNVVPVTVHLVLDLGLGAFLVASSFLFDFEDVSGPRIFTIVLGVAELLLVVATRWKSAGDRRGRAAYG
jgi:hypothetical protein